MEPILSRCGYRCDLCLAYAANLDAHPENAQILSDGWFTYFGFRINPENIRCDGCLQLDGQRIDSDCPVRPCVLEHGYATCAECEAYVCPKLQERIVTLPEVRQRVGHDIPAEDILRFIQPYENLPRLLRLRMEAE
jgi:hypothetical protein